MRPRLLKRGDEPRAGMVLARGIGPLQKGAVLGDAEVAKLRELSWNELSVDGRSVADAGVFHSPRGIVVPLDIGEHEIRYTWRPDRAWVWLNRISRVTLVLWIGLVLALHARGVA